MSPPRGRSFLFGVTTLSRAEVSETAEDFAMKGAFAVGVCCLGLVAGCRQPAPAAVIVTPATTEGGAAAASSVAGGESGVAAPAAVPMTHFSQGGVAFDYPAVWTKSAIAGGYLPTMIPQGAGTTVSFSPAGNYYKDTNLSGLQFTYETRPGLSTGGCVALLATNGDAAATKLTTVNGVGFRESSGGDAGMCHHRQATADVVFRGGTCYLFERDFDTICAGVKPGERELTATEMKALERHLDDVFKSVRFGGE